MMPNDEHNKLREQELSVTPLDVVRRLGKKEALRVAVDLNVRTGVDADTPLRAILISRFDCNQQQLQFHETKPDIKMQQLH